MLLPLAGKAWKLPWLREEKKILATFSPAQVSALINWKPVGRNQTRVRVAALTALDTGLRVGELKTYCTGCIFANGSSGHCFETISGEELHTIMTRTYIKAMKGLLMLQERARVS